MVSSFSEVDKDIIEIRITDPEPLCYKVTKYFTIGTIKKMLESEKLDIPSYEMVL